MDSVQDSILSSMVVVLQHALPISILLSKLVLDANLDKFGMETIVSIDAITEEYGIA